MKFRFVGGLDCPDWVLAEISQFSRILKEIFRTISRDICHRLINGKFDFGQDEISSIEKLVGMDSETLKGALAALGFILEKSAKNKCAPKDLEKEMLQLGMAFDHATELSSVYEEEFPRLSKAMSNRFPRQPNLAIRNKEEKSINGVQVYIYTVSESNGKTFELGMSEQKRESLKQEMKRAMQTFAPYE
ncbi:unnamed protein product [Bursaphelenchus xylophilus]|uniref:(pine wood nematode) hypothetical protein n=1 Tax=Bursaphelenchus xylophilus TaxID=6326 RepID=A0A1I7RL66_BURXY|nr:unnamed protein product [Bursaphelenchus xylophilus]CAG9083392.1 unnamed protein product [Bursaphelenchus xylophilus]